MFSTPKRNYELFERQSSSATTDISSPLLQKKVFSEKEALFGRQFEEAISNDDHQPTESQDSIRFSDFLPVEGLEESSLYRSSMVNQINLDPKTTKSLFLFAPSYSKEGPSVICRHAVFQPDNF